MALCAFPRILRTVAVLGHSNICNASRSEFFKRAENQCREGSDNFSLQPFHIVLFFASFSLYLPQRLSISLSPGFPGVHSCQWQWRDCRFPATFEPISCE